MWIDVSCAKRALLCDSLWRYDTLLSLVWFFICSECFIICSERYITCTKLYIVCTKQYIAYIKWFIILFQTMYHLLWAMYHLHRSSDWSFALNDLLLDKWMNIALLYQAIIHFHPTMQPSNLSCECPVKYRCKLTWSDISLLMLLTGKFARDHFPNIQYEADSLVARISLPTVVCQFTNFPNTFLKRTEMYSQIYRGMQCHHWYKMTWVFVGLCLL